MSQVHCGQPPGQFPKERVMSLSFKKIVGAGLLTLAVVGGTATYLNSTLKIAPSATVALDGLVSEQSQTSDRHAEVIVTEGPAS